MDEREIQYLGNGTQSDPFIISDEQGLNGIRNNLSAFYKLGGDIDLQGGMIAPIGAKTAPFTGGIDGDGYAIRNFKISGKDYTGLFGYVQAAEIKNIGVDNVENKSTGSFAGALIGYMLGGSVVGCYANGKVESYDYAGVLIGYAGYPALISDSYAKGSVIVVAYTSNRGGLIGLAGSVNIKNCYAVVNINLNGSGLAYVTGKSSVTESYFDNQLAKLGGNDSYNIGKLTVAMLQKELYAGWDFETMWDIGEGETYPYHRKSGRPEGKVDPGEICGGVGTEAKPYLLENKEGLDYIKYDMKGYYRLIKNIECAGSSITPIGSSEIPFSGSFDGDGNEIRNFKINEGYYTSLFGYTQSAKFKNIKFQNAEITGSSNYVGIVAGYMKECMVENICMLNFTVIGKQYTGAMVGYVYNCNVKGCCTKGKAFTNGTLRTGGLIGEIAGNSNSIEECCVSGNTTAGSYVGGLIGCANADTILSNCFASGNVMSTSGKVFGGLVGYASSTYIKNSYAATSLNKGGCGLASGLAYTENSYFDSSLAGTTEPITQARTTEMMKMEETYIGWDWNQIWMYKENFYPILRNNEMISQEPFDLTFRKCTSFSVILEWEKIQGAKVYKIYFQNNILSSSISDMLVDNLMQDTEYEFRVCAEIGSTIKIWSNVLKIRTARFLILDGLHSIKKSQDSLTLTWNPVDGVERYELIYNNYIQNTEINVCEITGLITDVPYMICIKAFLDDGNVITSNFITEKIYILNPQTQYANEFIEKCEGQTWFMDEIENILNMKGKSINTISSKDDFSTIYALNLADRGISGKKPNAMEELFALKYINLNNNKINN